MTEQIRNVWLSCNHVMQYQTPMPRIGHWLWCRKCCEYRQRVARPTEAVLS